MAINGSPVGFIDWDTARPLDPLWELAQVAWLNAQLHGDNVAELTDLGAPRREFITELHEDDLFHNRFVVRFNDIGHLI